VAVSPQEFAESYWDQQPLLSRAEQLPRPFTDLLSLIDVDELLSQRALRTPFIRLAQNGNLVAPSRWTGSGGIGAGIKDQVIDDRVLKEFAAGSTIVLQGLHRLWPKLAEFALQLIEDLGHPVQINAYITPPQSQGFDDHYDTHDVFVLALSGEKRWRIRPPVIEAPSPQQPWTDNRAAVAAAAQEPPLIDEVLLPGDSLYLPRGYLHSAVAQGITSAHLTVGIHPMTRKMIFDAVLSKASKDHALRRSLPIGIATAPAEELAAIATQVSSEVLSRLTEPSTEAETETEDVDALRTLLIQRLDRDTRPAPVWPLAQTLAADQLKATDTVQLRDGLRPHLSTSEGQLLTRAGGIEMSLPAATGNAVAVALDGAPHQVADLPDLAPAAQIACVQNLMRAGLVVRVDK